MPEKIAVVTGAAGGMGSAICTALNESQWFVVAIDRDEAGLRKLASGMPEPDRFQSIEVDLTVPEAIADAFGSIAKTHGGMDALVNNAGTCLMGEFPDITAEELDRQMAINFTSAFHCAQQAIKLMAGREGVRKIVNISSNGAYNFDVFDPPHYRASKAALDTLTKDLARRYAREKIAVNSIAPAMTQTPLFGVLTREVLDQAIAQMPHGEAMQPSQIAAWVAFLLSPAGDICSGNVVILNQGRDVR